MVKAKLSIGGRTDEINENKAGIRLTYGFCRDIILHAEGFEYLPRLQSI